MISTPVDTLVVRHSTARFSGAQGYALDGDHARLSADVALDGGDGREGAWALQLWACDWNMGQGGMQGIKVAEMPVGALPASGAASLDGWATALPPAGQRAHTMVLALASGNQGVFDQIHDLAVFPVMETFLQPALQGVVGYCFDAGRVTLSVDAVANPRSADNVSGSLILELWALPRAYQGGAFEGVHVATADIGWVAGQASLSGVWANVPAATVPAGTWQLVLMLREWTPAGYVTRDYSNFAAPLVVAAEAEVAPVAVEETPAPVVEAAPVAPAAKKVEAATPAPVKAVETAKNVEPAKAKPVVKPVEATKAAAAAPEKAKVAEPVVAKAAESAAPAKAAATEAGKVSINKATAAELAAIKGLSKTVAAAIVAARPYATLDDVARAKGMGAKLLAKLRAHLTL